MDKARQAANAARPVEASAIFANDRMPIEVEAAYARFEGAQRTALLELRDIVLTVARGLSACGGVVETLKWGEPSYLPKTQKVGTTVRLSTFGKERVALFVSCQTDLVDRYKEIFGTHLSYSKSRAVVFDPAVPLPQGAIEQCVSMALSYHLQKRGLPSNQP